MGMNIGDIIVEGDDIYVDGVNIAARLEGLAERGDAASQIKPTSVPVMGDERLCPNLAVPRANGRRRHCHVNRSVSQLGRLGSKFRPPCSRFAKRRKMRFEVP